jgi:inhibitor of the pro-sigma K processing machinery
MDFTTDIWTYLGYAAGVLAVCFFGKLLILPVKLLLRLIISSALGAVALFVINYFGVNIGLEVPLNFINAGVVGVLGIPGLIGLLVYFW